MTEHGDPARTGAELVEVTSATWITPGHVRSTLVVLIHGFTSHGRYLHALGQYLAGHGYTVAILNYDSYAGIDRAARDLGNLLAPLEMRLSAVKLVLVGHSMGGLVARYYAAFVAGSAGVPAPTATLLLGTPNAGTLQGRRVVAFMLRWGAHISSPDPFARSSACVAARQLTRNDSADVVGKLIAAEKAGSGRGHVCSISGAFAYLELGPSQQAWRNRFRNWSLQRAIGEVPNDGLVPESSASVVAVLGSGPTRAHRNSYPEYNQMNHTYLTRSNGIGLIATKWLVGLKEGFPLRMRSRGRRSGRARPGPRP